MSHGRTDQQKDWPTRAMKEDRNRQTLRSIREERKTPHVGEEKKTNNVSKHWWQFWK